MTEEGDDAGDVSVDDIDLDAVRSDLEADRITTRRKAVERCTAYATAEPSQAPAVLDLLVERLDDEAIVVSQRAAESISEIAVEHPDVASQAAEPLIDAMVENIPMNQFYAAAAVRPIAAHEPTAFATRIEEMLEILQERVEEAVEHEGAESVSAEYKESLDNISRTETQSQMAAHGIVANVIAAIAEERPELLAPHVDTLTELLEGDVELVLVTVLDTLATLAEHDPETVEDALDHVVSLLDHHDAGTRAGAIKVLGFIGDPETVDVLRGVAKTDANEDVRALADETISFLS